MTDLKLNYEVVEFKGKWFVVESCTTVFPEKFHVIGCGCPTKEEAEELMKAFCED